MRTFFSHPFFHNLFILCFYLWCGEITMRFFTRELCLESTGKTDFIDVTEDVKKHVCESGIRNGSVTVYSKHTTCSVRINENEPLLIKDLRAFFEKIAPQFRHYNHDRIDERPVPEDEQVNGHSHLKSIILGCSESIPISDGKLCLGKWQSIFFIDLDGPRKRKVVFHSIGE